MNKYNAGDQTIYNAVWNTHLKAVLNNNIFFIILHQDN